MFNFSKFSAEINKNIISDQVMKLVNEAFKSTSGSKKQKQLLESIVSGDFQTEEKFQAIRELKQFKIKEIELECEKFKHNLKQSLSAIGFNVDDSVVEKILLSNSKGFAELC